MKLLTPIAVVRRPNPESSESQAMTCPAEGFGNALIFLSVSFKGPGCVITMSTTEWVHSDPHFSAYVRQCQPKWLIKRMVSRYESANVLSERGLQIAESTASYAGGPQFESGHAHHCFEEVTKLRPPNLPHARHASESSASPHFSPPDGRSTQ